MKRPWTAAIALALLIASASCAVEPNDTFATATLMPAGVLSVTDHLAVERPYPDTLLGIRSPSGSFRFTNDDDSIYGNGLASGLQNVPIESDAIRFAITGVDDHTFGGRHSETGQYEVFVDVYDFSKEPVDSFSEMRALEPDVVHEFLFSDPDWINGTFDVNIDNTSGGNDVDFFTFSGLPPDAAFVSRTLDPISSQVDTVLGWFDETGMLLEIDDDRGGGTLSLIRGAVPASGMLTFAVTGFGDTEFLGAHEQAGDYVLELTIGQGGLRGDYNGNGIVDAADYPVWRDTLGQTVAGLAADGDGDNEIGAGDYAIWKSQFGETAAGGVNSAVNVAVPEPESWLLVALGVGYLLARCPDQVRDWENVESRCSFPGRRRLVGACRDRPWRGEAPVVAVDTNMSIA